MRYIKSMKLLSAAFDVRERETPENVRIQFSNVLIFFAPMATIKNLLI